MATPMPTRRTLLAAATGSALAACVPAAAVRRGDFSHGVASGDPLADRVILWTRYLPADAAPEAAITWQMARDAGFSTILRQGEATARAAADYTVKVDAEGLEPGQSYFYRFLAGDRASPVGRTHTLPVGNVAQYTLAVFSCANIGFGYFNAYRHAAERDDIDLVVHLGDYIYEYGLGRYPAARLRIAGRDMQPASELVALQDYRQRYASYRADPDLQQLHARHPMIAIWDDHETADNAWADGATNHTAGQGDWALRRKAALQAYYEWLPIRGDPADVMGYRSFPIGTLADLIMLDTRLAGRSRQLGLPAALRDTSAETVPPAALRAFLAALRDERRSLLGLKQEAWLQRQLADSTRRGARWQIIGQQVLVGAVTTPAAFAEVTPPGDSRREARRLRAQLNPLGVPSSLDSWAGYPAARQRLLTAVQTAGDNVIFLAGDTHNAWAFALPDTAGGTAAVEFAAPSVTSPGAEAGLSPADMAPLAQAMREASPGMLWCDLQHRGYLAVTLTPAAATARWLLLRDIRQRDLTLTAMPGLRVASQTGPGLGPVQPL
jgi:alkaline phosphatase D